MLTVHDKLKDLVSMRGTDILRSPYLLAYMADVEVFRDPENRPYRHLFKQMVSQGHVEQIALMWSSSVPSPTAYVASYPGVEQWPLRYAIECIGYATGRLEQVSTAGPSSDIEQTINLEDDTVEYISHGSSDNIGTLIPAVMAAPVHRHLNAIAAEEGGVAEYVRQEMIEPSVEAIRSKISGEQIDGVALAMRQMSAGRAFVLGDMTGIGKGRQLAMLLKWAQRHGYKPVFVTEKSTLFNDLYRDLHDVGYADMRPFILNADSNARITDRFGSIVYNRPSADEMEEFRKSGKIPAGYDFLLLTYSQLNKDRRKSWKPDAVLSAIEGSVLILDESHNASGIDSNVGIFFRAAVQLASSVCFASATYAKYPSSMPIYALKTALSNARIPAADLIDIVTHGGPILQEVMAQGLVESGSMVRRQRDMSEVERVLDTPSEPDVIESLRMSYDKVIAIIDDIREFHKKFLEPYTASIDAEGKLRAGVKVGRAESWVSASCEVRNWNPQLRLSPTIRQLLFAIKTEQAVANTLAELQAGRKPIVQISRTMASNIGRLIRPGEDCTNPDFALVLKDCVDDLFHYTVAGQTSRRVGNRDKLASYQMSEDYTFADVIAYYNSSEWLNSGVEGASDMARAAQACYDQLLNTITTVVTGLPLSPIDYFVQRIEAEGYKVGELTQRNALLMYDDVHAGPNSRVTCLTRKKPDKKQLAADFNGGTVDVLIGNRVMASGISLHSSSSFADTRQRVIITWEQQDSADLQTQFDGRADRTGQVSRCKYVLLSSPVPAEKRYLMMHSRKQRSLNANVEANQGRDRLCADIFNKYGARVIDEFVADNPEYAMLRSESLAAVSNFRSNKPISIAAKGEYVATFMRNLGLLICAEQDTILTDILGRYDELMSSLDAEGENDLQVTVLPLQAALVSRGVFEGGMQDADSPFCGDACLDEMEVNVLRKPLTAAQIAEQMKVLRDHEDLAPHIKAATDARVESLRQYYASLRSRALQQLALLSASNDYTPSRVKMFEERANNTGRMNAEIDNITDKAAELQFLLSRFRKGRAYAISTSLVADGQTDDPELARRIPSGIFMGYNVRNDTYTRSRIQAVFAVSDSRSVVRIPLTETDALKTILSQTSLGVSLMRLSTISLHSWDSEVSHNNRERAYIITGNILAGIQRCKDNLSRIKKSRNSTYIAAMTRGKMVKFTDINGNIRSGYMLSRIFDPKIYYSNLK